MSNGAFTGVDIVIEGIFPLLFRRDQGGQIVECSIGAVKNVPEHSFSLLIEKDGSPVNPGTVFDNLRLQVQHTSQTNITLKSPNGPIDRLTGDGDQQSFKWVLDFEGNEAYKRAIDINKRNLSHILRIDRGELSTADISQNHLLKRFQHEEQWTLIGKVATLVRVRIALDRPDSEAVLINGDFPVEGTRTRRGEQLEIGIHNRRPPHPGPHPGHPDDANHYHIAIGPGLQPHEKLIFKSTPLIPTDTLPATPEASCLVGRLGSTEGEP